MLTPLNDGLERRLIILLRLSHGDTLEVLLPLEGGHRTLPQILISGSRRVAEQLVAALRELYALDAVSVLSLSANFLEPTCGHVAYEVMRVRRASDKVPLNRQWLAVDALVESEFENHQNFQAIRHTAAQLLAPKDASPAGPFARWDWFDELESWVEEQVGQRGLRLTGRFRQLNACPTFSLIRFETDGPAVWFKATGEPNTHEFRLTETLTRLFPRFLPALISTRPEWNGWLAREADGFHLDEASEPAAWFRAARHLAELQAGSAESCRDLLDSGARDVRFATLRCRVGHFFQTIGELMEQQTRIPPPALSRIELHDLSAQLLEALDVLEETHFPATLGHLDLNPGNILCATTGTVFLDWAEGFVGHPFLAFEYLFEHFRRSAADQAFAAEIRACYGDPWRTAFSDSAIRHASNMAPLVAVFAYAARSDLWTQPRTIGDAGKAASLRSLTRRMHREAVALRERSLVCRP